MSTLHKKCFLASAGTHGLLFLVLLVGPAFLVSRQENVDDMPILDFIPSTLLDEEIYRASAPTQQPEPAPPKPQVTPREPAPSKPVKVSEPERTRVKPETKAETGGWKPTAVKIETAVRKPAKPQKTTPRQEPNRDARAAANAIRTAAATPSIQITATQSGGGQAYANYAQIVKGIYDRSWLPPAETSRDDAIVKVRIEIARDGTILSSSVIGRSGDASVDASVEAALRRVSKVPAFPAGAKEAKRTYTLGFNLKTKRAL